MDPLENAPFANAALQYINVRDKKRPLLMPYILHKSVLLQYHE